MGIDGPGVSPEKSTKLLRLPLLQFSHPQCFNKLLNLIDRQLFRTLVGIVSECHQHLINFRFMQPVLHSTDNDATQKLATMKE